MCFLCISIENCFVHFVNSIFTLYIIMGMNSILQRGLAPEHPGLILKEMYVEPLGINNNFLAEKIGVSRITVNKLLNGRQGITAEMALRLSRAFSTSPLLWLNLQRNYDLWQAEKKFDENIKAIA